MESRAVFSAVAGIVVLALAGATQVLAQTVSWQILSWPDDATWPGWNGHPTVNLAGQQIYEGRDARTVESFTVPKTNALDVILESRR